MIHDLSALSEHFLDTHKLGVKSYFEKYVAGAVADDAGDADEAVVADVAGAAEDAGTANEASEEGTNEGEGQNNEGGMGSEDQEMYVDDDDDIAIIDFVEATIPEKTPAVKREVKTERRENVDAENSTNSIDISDVKLELAEPYEAEFFSEPGDVSEEHSDQDNTQSSLLNSESETASG